MNSTLARSPEALETTPYESNWICIVDADLLDTELPDLRIGNGALAFYREELDRFRAMARAMKRTSEGSSEDIEGDGMYEGELQDFNDRDYRDIIEAFFER